VSFGRRQAPRAPHGGGSLGETKVEKETNKMRIWLSGPRMFNGLVRPGISLGREDWSPRLPSWRRYELRKGLQAAAEARGEPMSRDTADYVIDKCLATGGLDSAGNLCFAAKGTREEIVGQIMEVAEALGHPMTSEEAATKADAAIGKIQASQFWSWLGAAMLGVAIAIAVIFVAVNTIAGK